MPQDTSATAQPATLASSTAGSTPFRARLSLLRQRIILTLRWVLRPLYHLPIDDVKEHNTQFQIDCLVELNERATETIRTLVRSLDLVNARLQWHESHIPRMRELRRRFEHEQERLRVSVNGETNGAKERLEHGIIGAIRE